MPRLAIVATCAIQVAASQAGSTQPERFTVISDGHPLAVWARRPAAPTATVLLLHGRTWSSRPDWDLQVPGIGRSVMQALATRSIAAYAVDLRGYGGTPRDATGFNTPRRSAADVLNVLAWIRQRHPGLPRPALVGWSRGGAIAMMAAQLAPHAISSLVLFGFSWDPALEFSDIDDADVPPARLPNTAAAAASDFISPAVTPLPVVRAFVEQALGADPTLVDVKGDDEFRVLAAARVSVPTMVIFGSRDPAFDRAGTERFVSALGGRPKRLVVLDGADHAAQLENTHAAWVDAVAGFIGAGR